MILTVSRTSLQRGKLQPGEYRGVYQQNQSSPWFKDTVIVVSSDHLAMNKRRGNTLISRIAITCFLSFVGQAAARDAGSEA